MKTGKLNKISDVAGVTVGHCTIDDGAIQTGVTVIMPVPDNPYINKLQAAQYVINGFGKSSGLIQIEELGQLESPIGLTNTLAVGRVQDALVGYMIARCAAENCALRSINVAVGECNDGKINDIAKRSLDASHVALAIANATADFELGSVGAGRAMVCYDLKGGIGSASRLVELAGATYTVGALVLANHGKLSQLTIDGQKIGAALALKNKRQPAAEQGSIVVIIASDAPLDARQLKRLCKRATAGIARTGSEFGNGSGDVVIAFSTANRIKPLNAGATEHLHHYQFLDDSQLDNCFSAVVEAVESSIINALENAESIADCADFPSLNDLLVKK